MDAKGGRLRAAREGARAGREELRRGLTGSERGRLWGAVGMGLIAAVAGLVTGDVRGVLVGLGVAPLAFVVRRAFR